MNKLEHNMQRVASAILSASRKRGFRASGRQVKHREDVPSDLLAQIKAEAAMAERKQHLASDLLAKALQRR